MTNRELIELNRDINHEFRENAYRIEKQLGEALIALNHSEVTPESVIPIVLAARSGSSGVRQCRHAVKRIIDMYRKNVNAGSSGTGKD